MSAFVSLEYYTLSESFEHNAKEIYVFNSLLSGFVLYEIIVEVK